MTVAQYASIRGVSRQRVLQLIKSGKIKAKLGLKGKKVVYEVLELDTATQDQPKRDGPTV